MSLRRATGPSLCCPPGMRFSVVQSSIRGSCGRTCKNQSSPISMGKMARDALRPNDSNEDNESRNATKENALHRCVVGNNCALPVLDDRCLQVLPADRLDLRGCCRYHLSSKSLVALLQVATRRTFPSWYATPGKVARNPGGLISAS